MSEVVSSRSSRRNSKKSERTITGFSKRSNIFVGGTLAAFLVASAGIGLAMRNDSTVPLSKSPEEISSKLYFQDTPLLDGWKVNESAFLEGRGDLTTAQNPAQIFSPDGKCSFIKQVLHLPSYQETRTDNFITRQYLYEVAESNGSSGNDTDVLSVETDKGKLDFLSTSYLVGISSPTAKKTDDSPSTVYRSHAVRAIDKAVQIEGVKETDGKFGSDASKGIPVFSLSYECETQDDWNEDTWKALVESTKLSLYTEEVPEQAKPDVPTPETTGATSTGEATASPTSSSSASAEPADERTSPTSSTTPKSAESTEE